MCRELTLWRGQLVAIAVNGEDVRRLVGMRLDLLPQLHDEVVDGAVRRCRLEAPDLLEDLVAAHRLTDALHEEPQELDLVERERVLDVCDAQRVRREADLRRT